MIRKRSTISFLILFLAACSAATPSSVALNVTSAPTSTPIPVTALPTPTSTLVPSPQPTGTFTPTPTLTPTFTPTPTPTPSATATATSTEIPWKIVATSLPTSRMIINDFEVDMTLDKNTQGTFDIVGRDSRTPGDPDDWTGRVFLRLETNPEGTFLEYLDGSNPQTAPWHSDWSQTINVPPDGQLRIRRIISNGITSVSIRTNSGFALFPIQLPRFGFADTDGVRFADGGLKFIKFSVLIPPAEKYATATAISQAARPTRRPSTPRPPQVTHLLLNTPLTELAYLGTFPNDDAPNLKYRGPIQPGGGKFAVQMIHLTAPDANIQQDHEFEELRWVTIRDIYQDQAAKMYIVYAFRDDNGTIQTTTEPLGGEPSSQLFHGVANGSTIKSYSSNQIWIGATCLVYRDITDSSVLGCNLVPKDQIQQN